MNFFQDFNLQLKFSMSSSLKSIFGQNQNENDFQSNSKEKWRKNGGKMEGKSRKIEIKSRQNRGKIEEHE
jgi:hypothetical protein